MERDRLEKQPELRKKHLPMHKTLLVVRRTARKLPPLLFRCWRSRSEVGEDDADAVWWLLVEKKRGRKKEMDVAIVKKRGDEEEEYEFLGNCFFFIFLINNWMF